MITTKMKIVNDMKNETEGQTPESGHKDVAYPAENSADMDYEF